MKFLSYSIIFVFFCISCSYYYPKSGYYRGCCPNNQGSVQICEGHNVLCENGEHDPKCYCTSTKNILEFSGLNQYELYNIFSNYIKIISNNNVSIETQRKIWSLTLKKAYYEGYSPADVEAMMDLLYIPLYNKPISDYF